MENKLKLYGFNNLTKALSFNIYDVCYAKTEREQQKYIAYIDEQYNSDRLVKILTNVSQMIGAEVLNISKQDYDPQGASVTLLLAEDAAIKRADSRLVLGHLDKSHVTAHTYPGDLRGDHAAFYSGLSNRQLRFRHHHAGLPRAWLYA